MTFGLDLELARAVPESGLQNGPQGAVQGPDQVQVAVLVQVGHHDALALVEDPIAGRIGPDGEGAVVLQDEPVPCVPAAAVDAPGAPSGSVVADHDEVERGVRVDDGASGTERGRTGVRGRGIGSAGPIRGRRGRRIRHLRRSRAGGRVAGVAGVAVPVGGVAAGHVIGVRPVEEGPPEGIAGVHIGIAQGAGGAELAPGRLVVALELPELGGPRHHVGRGAGALGGDGIAPGSRFRRGSRSGAGGGDSRGVSARSPSRPAGPAASGRRSTAGGGTGGLKRPAAAASRGGPVGAGKWKRSRRRIRSDPCSRGGTRIRPVVGFIARPGDELPDQRREQRRGQQRGKEAEAPQPSAVPSFAARLTHCKIGIDPDLRAVDGLSCRVVSRPSGTMPAKPGRMPNGQ